MPENAQALLVVRLGEALKAHGHMLATAESCTGGALAEAVTAIAGSSVWFDCGFVTYSNESKQTLLGVRAETLTQFGAVSEETAREMAAGVLAASRAWIAVSITGIAGPDGGTEAKPVGTVCFGWAGGRETGKVGAETQYFKGSRAQVRAAAVEYALNGLLLRIA